MAENENLPKATCTTCGRAVKCIRVSDGTVYKPIGWVYPDATKPLEGVCGGCQTVAAASMAVDDGPCEVCGQPGRRRPDPFNREVYDEVRMRTLCDRHYEERHDDV